MEESFGEQIIPGTYIRVQAESLISPQGVATGNVGIVGTAAKATDPTSGPPTPEVSKVTHILSSLEDARKLYMVSDSLSVGKQNLMRSLELLFRNGASTVYAYALPEGATQADFKTGFDELLKENVNILVAPELTTANAKDALGIVETAESQGKDVIAVIGCDTNVVATIKGASYIKADKRIVMCAPGIETYDVVDKKFVALPGNYTAAAVAGLIASLAPQSSPTNKVLPTVNVLTQKYSYGELKDLLNAGILTLESRQGVRVVRGLTTHGAGNAFSQITTRRIVDAAKAGIRQVSSPFIGKLNNERVRKALQGAVDNLLTTMVVDEALTGYTLEVKASRADEIAGRCVVNVAMQPTFSIDYIRVTLALS